MNGKRLIASLQQFADDVRTGRPVKQSIVRRMKVKGRTVHARETFTAPVKVRPPKDHP